MSSVRHSLILGTAGHVDHGKTALVRALTGTDTDRLEEEHRRGISIELGFAQLKLDEELSLGVVDVPGHERFVRQMVAGAGGMDLAMLLVAADEGVMPQTREHLDVLKLLGVEVGLVVITKIDLVEIDLREVVREEIFDLVADSFLQDAPVLEVSAVSGEGLSQLKDALKALAESAGPRRRIGDFRLPVDRVFAMPGSGVVITGTVWSGEVKVGDSLRSLPGERNVRVREVQNHGQKVERGGAGERLALALHGVKKDEIQRGDQLIGGRVWQPAEILGVRVQRIRDKSTSFPIRQRARFHVHHAAREVLGRLDLLEGNELSSGQSTLACLLLESSLVAAPGDRIVLRSYSPMITVAGAVVVDPQGQKGLRRADSLERYRRMEAAGVDGWPGIRVEDAGLDGFPLRDWLQTQAMLGRDEASAQRILQESLAADILLQIGDRLFSPAIVENGALRALELIRKHQQRDSLSPGMPREELRQEMGVTAGAAAFALMLRHWNEKHPLFLLEDRVRADSERPQLDSSQEQALDEMEDRIRKVKPAYEAETAEMNSGELALLVKRGVVIKLGGRLLAHRDGMVELGERVKTHFAAQDQLDIARVKEWTGASRKFVVPLMEWLDGAGFTRFDGKKRTRGPACD